MSEEKKSIEEIVRESRKSKPSTAETVLGDAISGQVAIITPPETSEIVDLDEEEVP